MSVHLGFGVLTTVFALVVGLLSGGIPSLLQVDLGFRYDGEALTVQLDPVFIVRGPDLRAPCGAPVAAAAFSNVIFWTDGWPDALYASSSLELLRRLPPRDVLVTQVMTHEYLHVRQHRATGPLFYFVRLGVDWEGAPGTYSLLTMDALNRTMWQPPVGWPDLGTFITFRYTFRRSR